MKNKKHCLKMGLFALRNLCINIFSCQIESKLKEISQLKELANLQHGDLN